MLEGGCWRPLLYHRDFAAIEFPDYHAAVNFAETNFPDTGYRIVQVQEVMQ